MGFKLALKQIWAMIVKRFLYNRRNLKSLFTQIILPAFFICVAMATSLSAPGFFDLPSLELTPAQFYPLNNPESIVVPYYYSPQQNCASTKFASSKEIIQTLHYLTGIGSTCVLNKPNLTLGALIEFNNSNYILNQKYFGNSDSCSTVFNSNPDFDYKYFKFNTTQHKSDKKIGNLYPSCVCLSDLSGFKCLSDFDEPQSFRTVSRETLLNITATNETNYYLFTTDAYRLRRYGGLGLDYEKCCDEEAESLSTKLNLIAKRAGKVWYNHKGFHSMPTFLNVMNNAILRANVKNKFNKIDSGRLKKFYHLITVNA